jgi:hypothetical protein
VTAADLARAIHDRHCASAASRNRSMTPWRELTPYERDQLENDASKLLSAYASGGNAPSKGMKA